MDSSPTLEPLTVSSTRGYLRRDLVTPLGLWPWVKKRSWATWPPSLKRGCSTRGAVTRTSILGECYLHHSCSPCGFAGVHAFAVGQLPSEGRCCFFSPPSFFTKTDGNALVSKDFSLGCYQAVFWGVAITSLIHFLCSKPEQVRDDVRNPNRPALLLSDQRVAEYSDRGIWECRDASLKALQSSAAEGLATLAAQVRGDREGHQLFPMLPVAYLPTPYYGCLESGRPKSEWGWSFLTHEVHAIQKYVWFTGMTDLRAAPALWRCPGVPRSVYKTSQQVPLRDSRIINLLPFFRVGAVPCVRELVSSLTQLSTYWLFQVPTERVGPA